MSVWNLVVAVGLLAANAWFVAAEFALVASRRARIEARADEGSRRARLALDALSDLSAQLAATQLGITIASLALGFVAEEAIAHALEEYFADATGWSEGVVTGVSVAIALSIVVTLHMILGEMVPKNLAIAGPERTLLAMAPLNRVLFLAMRPVVLVLNALGNAVVRLLGLEPRDELGTAHTAQEFVTLLDASRARGHIDDFEHHLLSGAFDLGALTVGSILIPRADMVTVTRRMTVADIEAVLVRSGHSRLPIEGAGGADDILGFVHAKDLLRLPPAARDEPVPLEAIRRMLVVPPERSLEDVLFEMRRRRVHFAVVRSAGGRTVGMVTLEDVLEELVGDILDETDRIR